MQKQITMPQLRDEMKSGVFCAWLKEEGQPYKKGEPIFEIETDKVVNQITASEDGVDPGNCVGVHVTVDGPYGPVQYVNMRDFDWCPHCIEALAHEITHAARAALIDRNVYMGSRDRACETFSYVFSSLFLGFLEQLEKGDGWVPVAKKGKKK